MGKSTMINAPKRLKLARLKEASFDKSFTKLTIDQIK
jgi:hypothetical protein